MKPHLQARVARLQAEMDLAGLDLIVFTDRENLIYYAETLAIECMGMVIPREGDPVLCCLWLDTPYVKETTGAQHILSYHFPAANIGATVVKAMQRFNVSAPAVGFHKYFVEFGVYDAITKAFPDMSWHAAMNLTYKVRAVKEAAELVHMRTACAILDKGMEAATDHVRPGVTELDVLAEADYIMRKAGSDGATFRMQVLNWTKQLLAHPYATRDVILNNQPVVIHLGASCQGYTAKMCRTVFLGNVPDETLHIYHVLLTAQAMAIKACIPGTSVATVYNKVHGYISEQGYGELFLDHLGYGMGIRQSEFYPIVGKGLPHILEENMVVDMLLPTIYKQGVGGPRVTDVIHITPTGGELLTHFSREPIMR